MKTETMRSRPSKASRKGYYEIFGAFFLILVLIIATIGFIAFQNTILFFRQGVNKGLNEYNQALVVRERLMFCYGSILIPERMNDLECLDGQPLEKDILSYMIRGYRIEVEDLFGCDENLQWEWLNPQEQQGYANEFTFFVPVLDPDIAQNCLGKMTIII